MKLDNPKIIVTSDNSRSLFIPGLNETYHSIHGAMNESDHIFIKAGLIPLIDNGEIKILEMGFGTGLNALLTLAETTKHNASVQYHTIEKFPIAFDLIQEIDHPTNTNQEVFRSAFEKMHLIEWNTPVKISPLFLFSKFQTDILDIKLTENFYTLIYYDAFAPKIQPELWDYPVMQKMYDCLTPGGILVSYCAQGQFRRNLRQAGFDVTRGKGPHGKREITIAYKSGVKL